MGDAKEDAITAACIEQGGTPDACAKLGAGDYKGAAKSAGGAAAAGGCAAAGLPELAPICAKIGSEIAGAVVDFFSKKTCEGWMCVQQPPEEWAHWMKPEQIDAVNVAFNAWLLSGDPAVAPYTNTSTGAPTSPSSSPPWDGSFLDGHLTPEIPAGSLRRVYLSRWYQTFVQSPTATKTLGTAIKNKQFVIGCPPGQINATPKAAIRTCVLASTPAGVAAAAALTLAAKADYDRSPAGQAEAKAKAAAAAKWSTKKKAVVGTVAVVGLGGAALVGYRLLTGAWTP